jgi:hypothetical protein
MHTATQLDRSLFEVTCDGTASSREELLPDWAPHDRLGIVVTEPFGGIGASQLIQLAITAFYDVRPSRRGRVRSEYGQAQPNGCYPDIYLFHAGGPHGDHSWFDFWPARKEVFVARHARAMLDAINDRAITRLAVPDGEPTPVQHELQESGAARDRIVTALAYSATGRVDNPTFQVAGLSERTEANVKNILDPKRHYTEGYAEQAARTQIDPELELRDWSVRNRARMHEAAESLDVARARRAAIRNANGFGVESYRSITVNDALEMLV